MESRPDNPQAKEQKQQAAHCTRCSELEIIDIVSRWQWVSSTSVADPQVVQRLLFDPEHPFNKSCRTCRRMQRFLSFRRVYFTPTNVRTSQSQMPPSSSEWAIMLRTWDSPASEARGQTVYFGMSPPASLPLQRYAQPMLRVEHVREVGPHPNWALIKSWLHHCSDAHPGCQPAPHRAVHQIRVVDVRQRIVMPLPMDRPYICLSYVWGRVEQPVTKGFGPLPDNLGLTIEDAITVVKKLGYNYLWVDSICIDQHDALQKHDQIAIMDQIYHGAFATIIVLDSPDANSGIPGIRSARKNQQVYAEFDSNRMLSRLPPLSSELARSQWTTRAWTYQEGLLSHKRIVFTQYQVHMVCNELARSEDVLYDENLRRDWPSYQPLVNPLDFVKLSKTGSDGFEVYERLVNGYVGRQMTKQEDALNALTGLLHRMKEAVSEDFHGALPLSNFRQALLWIRDVGDVGDASLGQDESTLFSQRRLAAGLPSWSWVGWQLNNPIKIQSSRIHDSSLPPLLLSRFRGASSSAGWNYESNRIDPDRWAQSSEPDQNHKSQSHGNTYFQTIIQRIWRTYQNNTVTLISPGPNLMRHENALSVKGITLKMPCRRIFSRVPNQSWFRFDFGEDNARYSWDPADLSGITAEIFLDTDPFARERSHDKASDEQGIPPQSEPEGSGIEVTELDFLWVSNRILRSNADNVFAGPEAYWTGISNDPNRRAKVLVGEWSLILLLWEDGIAYRGGVVKLKAQCKFFERLLTRFPPRYTNFWLG